MDLVELDQYDDTGLGLEITCLRGISNLFAWSTRRADGPLIEDDEVEAVAILIRENVNRLEKKVDDLSVRLDQERQQAKAAG